MTIKKEFKINTRVRFINLPECELSGLGGKILGKSFENVHDHYIVLLDHPMPDRLAVCMTEHCLEKE